MKSPARPRHLAANGVLVSSYETCRRLHRRHGTTYYMAARLLPVEQRRHVHALYGFCRYADDVVDDLAGSPVEVRAEALEALGAEFATGLGRGYSEHPVVAALVDTVHALGIDPTAIGRFLRSMEMDLTVDHYERWADLCVYMDGSAAVIGEMMLPVLAPVDVIAAVAPARALGNAFQLTNFLRDVGEDLARGRVYLPQEDLAMFGADPARRRVSREWADVMGFEIERARALYAEADRGIALLPPRSSACVRAARDLYAAILDCIEANGYDVFSRRARVSSLRKAATATRCFAGTIGTRNP